MMFKRDITTGQLILIQRLVMSIDGVTNCPCESVVSCTLYMVYQQMYVAKYTIQLSMLKFYDLNKSGCELVRKITISIGFKLMKEVTLLVSNFGRSIKIF